MSKRSTAAAAADNPTIHYAEVKVDGETYKLTYDFNGIAQAERIANVNLLQGLANLSNLSGTQFRGLLFAAMLKAQPKITIDEVGALIRLDTMIELQDALAEAYVRSLPPAKKETSSANPPEPVTPAN